MQMVYVWDFPTRLFHWLLVLAIGFQYVSAELLDDAMQWHFYIGYCTLGLVIFRVIWGFVGHFYSRFSTFMRSPANVIRYAIGQDQQTYLTHNPMGAWSVIVMLTLIATQAVSGLFISDDIFLDGPWHHVVSTQTADLANWLHHNMITLIWIVLVAHLVALAYYQYRGHNIIQSMVHGRKASTHFGNDLPKHQWIKFIVAALIAATIVYLIVDVIPPEPDLYDF